MFLLSSHLNVTCLPIPFLFHFFQPPNSQVFRKHMKKTWFCVLHAASVSTTGPGWESIREAAMAQKGVTLCAMSLGNETHTTLVGGLGSGGEHCCLLKVPDICRDCMLLMTFYLGIWFSQKDADLLRGLDVDFWERCRLKPRRVCFLSPRRPVRE